MKKAAADIFKYGLVLFLGIVIGKISLGDQFVSPYSIFQGFNSDDKLSKVIQLIRKNYVDSVNLDSLQNRTISELLQSLDPHSAYLPPVQANASKERLEGRFEGVGLEYHILRDTLHVTYVYPGGPSAKAGLQPGDRILKVDGENFFGTGLTPERVVTRFKGKQGSIVELAVRRFGSKGLKTFKVERGQVDLSSVDVSYITADKTGYIKVSKFAATTNRDFREALHAFNAGQINRLVLDLRGNGGGYLNAATAMADEFLSGGKLIMFTKGMHEPRTDYFSTDSGTFIKGKLAVLIDEYSASASEIVAGAMQDLDRAVIVGRRSFGKGLVQEQFSFNDGSAVNLTVARYYTPSGRSIQKSYKMGIESYHNELSQRYVKGEMFSEESNFKDSLFQEKKYFSTSGRLLSSGGGIMPDVFVPADTLSNNWLLAEFSAQNLYMDFLIDKLQGKIKQYKSFNAFRKDYHLVEKDYHDFITYASRKIADIKADDALQCKERVLLLLKAHAARYQFGKEAYFKVLNEHDHSFKKAIEAVQ
jgi:carboxyl-terminal processing protease